MIISTSNRIYRVRSEWPLGTTYDYFLRYIDQAQVLPVNMCVTCGHGSNYVVLRPSYYIGGNGDFGDFLAGVLGHMLVEARWINVAVFESDGLSFERIFVCKQNGILLKSYKGPEFLEMIPTCSVPYIEELTTLSKPIICPTCHNLTQRFSGFEFPPDADGNPCPRDPNGGLFVRRSDLRSNLVFRTELTGGFFCTEEFRQRIESMNLTNIRFRECGTVIEDE